MGLFRPDRIVAGGVVPEYFCHGVRSLELLPGDIVRAMFCRDEPVPGDGIPPMSVPVIAVTVPARCMIWNSQATFQWAFDAGLTARVQPLGPVELRQGRVARMM